jgi:hypothetical protein
MDITNTYSADIEPDGSGYSVTVIRRERDGRQTELAVDRFNSYDAAVAFARRIADNDTRLPYSRNEIAKMMVGTKD